MKVLLCGIGNLERGDDGFGPYIIQKLPALQRIQTIDCGVYIENYLNKIITLAPDLIIFFDTVLNASATVLLRNEEILKDQTLSLTTHTIPFSAVYEYIKVQCPADIWLVGVQPRSYIHFSDSVRMLAHKIIQWLEYIDNEIEIDIIKTYETLFSTIR